MPGFEPGYYEVGNGSTTLTVLLTATTAADRVKLILSTRRLDRSNVFIKYLQADKRRLQP